MSTSIAVSKTILVSGAPISRAVWPRIPFELSVCAGKLGSLDPRAGLALGLLLPSAVPTSPAAGHINPCGAGLQSFVFPDCRS